jgi:hypothetical protein
MDPAIIELLRSGGIPPEAAKAMMQTNAGDVAAITQQLRNAQENPYEPRSRFDLFSRVGRGMVNRENRQQREALVPQLQQAMNAQARNETLAKMLPAAAAEQQRRLERKQDQALATQARATDAVRYGDEMLEKEKDRAADVEIAKIKAASTGTGKPAWTSSERKKFEEEGSNLLTFGNIVENYKPEYSQPLGEEYEGVPGAGRLSNTVARVAPVVATDEMKDRQKWWADFNRWAELVERHELFGSALTATEQKQWNQSAINPDMDAGQVQRHLTERLGLMRKVMDHSAEVARQKNWPEEYVNAVTRRETNDSTSEQSGEWWLSPDADPSKMTEEQMDAWLEANP